MSGANSGESNILFFVEEVEFTFDREVPLSDCIKKIFSDHNAIPGSINVIFCSDQYLLRLNRDYLNHDYYTDILTFPMNENPLSGDLFISIDRVRINTAELQTGFNRELSRVVIHGVLHLLGYNDKTEEQVSEMREKEEWYLKDFL